MNLLLIVQKIWIVLYRQLSHVNVALWWCCGGVFNKEIQPKQNNLHIQSEYHKTPENLKHTDIKQSTKVSKIKVKVFTMNTPQLIL